MRPMTRLLLLAGVAALTTAPSWAQQVAPASGETIIVTGTRVEDRSSLDTAVPVDVARLCGDYVHARPRGGAKRGRAAQGADGDAEEGPAAQRTRRHG